MGVLQLNNPGLTSIRNDFTWAKFLSPNSVLNKMAPSEWGSSSSSWDPIGPFRYQSSPVDWCEPNYEHSSYIVEFFNTVSSIPIFMAGVFQLSSYETFIRQYDSRVRVLAFLIIMVASGSIWFHMTLSTMGQMADELFILWLLALAQAWYFPIGIFPKPSPIKRPHIMVMFVGLALVSTCLCQIYPFINHFALVAISLPQYIGVFIAYFNRKAPPPAILTDLFGTCTCVWLLALFAWVVDQACCPTLLSWNFPYFHAIWHLLSSIGICQSMNLSIYLDLEHKNRLSHISVKLKRYPNFRWFSYQYLAIE
ncbi:alkaline ceramidase 2-like [Convolutriloba macropyga]|uniref:alkaline ceramidase 2-like n=1 Tax=Convolutriloba macropyga TaxID=536237 RepID=UPI003F5251DE